MEHEPRDSEIEHTTLSDPGPRLRLAAGAEMERFFDLGKGTVPGVAIAENGERRMVKMGKEVRDGHAGMCGRAGMYAHPYFRCNWPHTGAHAGAHAYAYED